jgi:hypothetical protein
MVVILFLEISLKIDKQKLNVQKKLGLQEKLGLHSEVYRKTHPTSKRNRELVDDILVQFFTLHLSMTVRLIFFQ